MILDDLFESPNKQDRAERPEADYGDEYQAMVKRVGQRAKQGPLKTVWDPEKRVYKNVPKEQPTEEMVPEESDNHAPFADGYLVASKHFLKDRSVQRNISMQQIQQILHRLEASRGKELAKMPFVTFVVKSPSLSVAISKSKDKQGKTAYVVTTAHENLRSGEDQDVFYLEEEQLDELYFLGSKCTTDCSGHRAGYDWSSKRGDIDSASWSDSFNKGAHLRATGN